MPSLGFGHSPFGNSERPIRPAEVPRVTRTFDGPSIPLPGASVCVPIVVLSDPSQSLVPLKVFRSPRVMSTFLAVPHALTKKNLEIVDTQSGRFALLTPGPGSMLMFR